MSLTKRFTQDRCSGSSISEAKEVFTQIGKELSKTNLLQKDYPESVDIINKIQFGINLLLTQ